MGIVGSGADPYRGAAHMKDQSEEEPVRRIGISFTFVGNFAIPVLRNPLPIFER